MNAHQRGDVDGQLFLHECIDDSLPESYERLLLLHAKNGLHEAISIGLQQRSRHVKLLATALLVHGDEHIVAAWRASPAAVENAIQERIAVCDWRNQIQRLYHTTASVTSHPCALTQTHSDTLSFLHTHARPHTHISK